MFKREVVVVVVVGVSFFGFLPKCIRVLNSCRLVRKLEQLVVYFQASRRRGL